MHYGNLTHVVATADALAKTGPGRVRFVFVEGKASVHWRLRDGLDNTGAIIGEFKIAAGGIGFEWPIQFAGGLFLDLIAGTTPTISVLFE